MIQRTLAILVLSGAGVWIYNYWASAPDRAQDEVTLAMKLLGVGTYDQAMRHFDRAIQIWPDYPDAYLNRGLAEHGARHQADALADFEKALRLDPNLIEAYNARGQIYLENGDVQKAILDCSRSIQRSPTVDAYYQRGQAYEKLGEHEKAIADFDAAIAESREAPFAYRARSVAKRNAGDRAGAQDDDDQARRIETGQSVEADVFRAP